MKGYLVWPDGRREETDWVGAIRIHAPRVTPEGRWLEHVFEADAEVVDDVVTYRHVESVDRTHENRMREARAMVEKARKRGVALPKMLLQGMHPGETQAEFEERRKVLREACGS